VILLLGITLWLVASLGWLLVIAHHSRQADEMRDALSVPFDPALTAGGLAGKPWANYGKETDGWGESYTGGQGDQTYTFGPDYCDHRIPDDYDHHTVDGLADAMAPCLDHHTIEEYEAIAGLQEEAIARSEQGEQPTRMERLP
jgi:hypothetical protein